MARRKKDGNTAAAILKRYAAGASLAELREKFGIRGKAQLATAVLNALIRAGKMPRLARGRAARPLPKEFKVAVNRKGTLVLPKAAVVDSFRLKPGQAFLARRRGRKIVLTLVG